MNELFLIETSLVNNTNFSIFAVQDGFVSQSEGFEFCKTLNMTLGPIRGEEEFNFVTDLVDESISYLFGMGLPDNISQPRDGGITELFVFLETDDQTGLDFFHGSPRKFPWSLINPDNNNGNERCIEINSSGRLNDVNCERSDGFLCRQNLLLVDNEPPDEIDDENEDDFETEESDSFVLRAISMTLIVLLVFVLIFAVYKLSQITKKFNRLKVLSASRIISEI